MTDFRFNLAYALTAIFYLSTMNTLPGYIGVGFKALPVLLLLVPVFQHLESWPRKAMVFALLFSAAGDVLLALDSHLGNLFVPGLGSFLVAQVIYAVIFWKHRSNKPDRKWFALAYIPFALLMGVIILPASGELMVAVFAYLLAISAMVTGAALCRKPLVWVFTGAVVFAVSDSLIAINKFIQPIPYEGFWIIASYYLAQFMIVTGMKKKEPGSE